MKPEEKPPVHPFAGMAADAAFVGGGIAIPGKQGPPGKRGPRGAPADVTAHEAAADPHAGYQKESEKGSASGYASLNASTLVVENPANATATPTASKIPIADGSGDIDKGWIPTALGPHTFGGASPSGTVKVNLASETAGTNVTMKAGSFIKYREVA